MCFVDAATSNIDIAPGELKTVKYKCIDCGNTFSGIGRNIKCSACESTNVEMV